MSMFRLLSVKRIDIQKREYLKFYVKLYLHQKGSRAADWSIPEQVLLTQLGIPNVFTFLRQFNHNFSKSTTTQLFQQPPI